VNEIRLALVTPWPPDRSGIADFARDLAIGLVEAGHTVDVFTHAKNPAAVDGVTIVPVPLEWDGAELDAYPHRLFQLGNHADYHGWMLGAMTSRPGVVQVHDYVLHHLLIGLTRGIDDWPTYVRAVREWYGDETAERAETALVGKARPLWEATEVIEFPFFEFFVSHAAGVIVHSRFAASRIVKRLPRLSMRQVAQTYRHETVRRRSVLRRIGIFGGVQANKRIDWVVQAFEMLNATLKPVEVVVVGTIEGPSEALVARAKALPDLTIRFTGRLEEDAFIAEFEQTDLCISLRHPTMGETSAVVMRALQHGVPTIVSDTGWYAELPGAVKKIPLENAPYVLSSLIARLLNEPDLYREWASACAELPRTLGLAHATMVGQIVDFVQSHHAERAVADAITRHLADLGFVGEHAERGVLEAVASRSVL